ncbi:tRNA-uridine aminocarboxypropyltransferase [Entamoeba marina]
MQDLPQLLLDDDDVTKTRKECPDCGLHPNICCCGIFSNTPIRDNTPNIVVLQDPRESKAKHNTVKLLTRFFKNIVVHKRNLRLEHTNGIRNNPDKFAVLFPSPDAIIIDKETKPLVLQQITTLIVIDGTWQQAKGIYTKNPILKTIPNLSLACGDSICQYSEIRKEVTGGMSTFEATMTALSIITSDDSINTERDRIMKSFVSQRTHFMPSN